jgi:hypothetical protein
MAAISRSTSRLLRLKSHFTPTTRTRPVIPIKSRHSRFLATMSIPKTMKGVLVEETGGPEVLKYRTDLPTPELKEGQILVKNEIIGINFIDT